MTQKEEEELREKFDEAIITFRERYDDDQLFNFFLSEIKERETELGFANIHIDHKSTLLTACENALMERDTKIASLQEQLRAADFHLNQCKVIFEVIDSENPIIAQIDHYQQLKNSK